MMKQAQPYRWTRGFTLIEMLTVIAIIAVLMALLFPVVVAQQARARSNACSANLAEIGGALRMYRLDNGVYPPALLGFVHKNNEGMPGEVVYGLYPHYVKSTTTFLCPNNPARRQLDDRDATRLAFQDGTPGDHLMQTPVAAPDLTQGAWLQGVNPKRLFPSGVVYPVGDSYDVSVLPTDAYGKTKAVWERHYALQWLPKADLRDDSQVNTAFERVMGANSEERTRTYARQLTFRHPDDATVVTVCTYHRDYPSDWSFGKSLPDRSTDIVLFLDGHTEVRRSAATNVYDRTGAWAGWQVYPNR